jgi:hypothetical protein
MSTIAAMNQVQGRITLLQDRLTSYLGDGPAGAGLGTAGCASAVSFADIVSRFERDDATPTAPASAPTFTPDQPTFPFRSAAGDHV